MKGQNSRDITSIKMPHDIRNTLRREACKRDVPSVSALVRQIIDEWLAKNSTEVVPSLVEEFSDDEITPEELLES